MGRLDKIREKVLGGNADHNVSFDELLRLARSLGLTERCGGSHPHLFEGKSSDGQPIFFNLQPKSGNKCKPYQVKQVRDAIRRHGL